MSPLDAVLTYDQQVHLAQLLSTVQKVGHGEVYVKVKDAKARFVGMTVEESFDLKSDTTRIHLNNDRR